MSRVNLPEEILKKMVCQLCENYLSRFPVYIKTDASGAICGRCKAPDESKYIRDEAYENLAQFLLFPCIYQSNGCQKNMVPNMIDNHEPCCEFRKYNCPTSMYTRCNWQGPKNMLFQHFSEKHPSSLIENKQFEFDFANSIEEKLLMKINEDLFVVKREIDSRMEIFQCSVEYLKSQENEDMYNYFLRIESNSRNFFYKCNERLADGKDITKLMGHILKEKLQEPSSMVVLIEVRKSSMQMNEEMTENVKRAEENPAIDWQILSELECPVCYDYMLPPIYQCSTGHSICKNCRPRVNNSCPTCKQAIGTTQNFVLEKMTQYITYPCKHHKLGCLYASKAIEIEAHEASCEFGPFDCPLKSENCDWSGTVSDVVTHVESNHSDSLLKNDRVEAPYNSEEQQRTLTYLLIFNKKIFKFVYKYANRFGQWSMQILGPMTEANKFKFEIDILDTTGGKKRFLISGPVVPITTTINGRNSIKLAAETIGLYADTNLGFLVRIVKE